MKKTMIVLACVIAAVCFGVVASAMEGGADTIDRFGAEATSFDHVTSAAGIFDTEISVKVPPSENWSILDWSILAGVSYRQVDPDWSANSLDGWGGHLGVKYYFTRMTSAALLGSVEEYDAVGAKNVTSATLAFEQRFLPARSGVSPFVDAGLSLRFPHYESADTSDKPDRDCMIKLGAGCDFMISETLALSFGFSFGSVVNNFNLGDITRNEGWTGTIGFVGYWDYTPPFRVAN